MRDSLGSGHHVTLSQAVDALYVASASHSRPARIDDSYGPLDPGVAQRVMTVPLHDVAPADMEALFSVLFDDEQAFAHFFPRYIELAARLDLPFQWPDLPFILEKARRLTLLADPPVVAATKRVLECLWEAVLTKSLIPHTVDGILLGFAWLEGSVQAQLDAWMAVRSLAGQVNVAEYVLSNLETLRTRRRLRNCEDWKDRPQCEIEVGEWLRSRALADRICDLARTTGEERLVEACAGLRDLHTAPTFH